MEKPYSLIIFSLADQIETEQSNTAHHCPPLRRAWRRHSAIRRAMRDCLWERLLLAEPQWAHTATGPRLHERGKDSRFREEKLIPRGASWLDKLSLESRNLFHHSHTEGSPSQPPQTTVTTVSPTGPLSLPPKRQSSACGPPFSFKDNNNTRSGQAEFRRPTGLGGTATNITCRTNEAK